MLPIIAGAAGMAGRAILQGAGHELAGKGLELAKDLLKNNQSDQAQGEVAQNTPPKPLVTY